MTLRAREQLNQGGQGLCEGDMVTRINNTPVTDAMTLKEARKLIESCKDRLNLVVTRELIREETVTNGNYQNNYNSLGKNIFCAYTIFVFFSMQLIAGGFLGYDILIASQNNKRDDVVISVCNH